MVYTLVSAATLGFDLARLPAGRQVADALLVGLLADVAQLGRIARQHRTHCVLDDPRLTLRADAGQARRARELAIAGGAHISRTGGALPGASAPGTRSPAALVAQLERSTLGDVAALERLVRGELVEPGDADERTVDLAREVLADAAVAAYAATALPAQLRRQLRSALVDAVGDGSPAVAAADLGPQGAAVLTALGAVSPPAAAASAARHAWRAAASAGGGAASLGEWSRAMHEACWAAHVSGRTRVTAAAQLLAVRALDDGGFTAADAAGGVWNAVSGVVQALAVADVLGAEPLGVLLAPWRRVAPPLLRP